MVVAGEFAEEPAAEEPAAEGQVVGAAVAVEPVCFHRRLLVASGARLPFAKTPRYHAPCYALLKRLKFRKLKTKR